MPNERGPGILEQATLIADLKDGYPKLNGFLRIPKPLLEVYDEKTVFGRRAV